MLYSNIRNAFGKRQQLRKLIYDAWGKLLKTEYIGSNIWSLHYSMAEENPFRYRGYYYDTETGFYFLKSCYYEPPIGRFNSADGQLNDGLLGSNQYVYCENNPVMFIDPSGNFAISTFLISMAVGTLVSWGLSEIFGSQIAGGISSVAGGGTAISTGISLCAFGPWGIVAGVTLMAIGAGTVAFGTNEIVAGATGTNYIQQWTGMSDGVYNGLYIGLNITSSLGSIAGNIGMKFASNRILNNIIKDPSQITNYKLWQIKTYGRYTTQWSVGTLNKGKASGKGYALRQIHDGRYIQWHPAGSTWHINQNPYWKICSGKLGKMWFDYITGLRFYP